MIRTLRAYFLGRLLREKLLLLVFLLFGVVWWATSAGARVTHFWRDAQTTTKALKEQEFWITNRVAVEEKAQTAADRLVPAKTLDSVRLVGVLQAAASEAGLRNFKADQAGRESSGQFTIHTASFTANGNTYDSYKKFYRIIEGRSPYIGIEQFGLTSNRAVTDSLTLSLRVSSVEVAR